MILEKLDLDLATKATNEKVIREIVAAAFWLWYQNNQELKVNLKIWFIPVRFRIRDLENVFILFFGPKS